MVNFFYKINIMVIKISKLNKYNVYINLGWQCCEESKNLYKSHL